jgi:uncharacterized protein (DUF58 family)
MTLSPHPRLLMVTALLLVPAMGFWFALPSHGVFPGAVVIAVVLACALDAWRGSGLLSGLSAAMPPVQRLGKDRAGAVELFFSGPLERTPRLRVGLPWPPAFRETADTLPIELPRGASRARMEWPCLATRRGVFRLRECAVETGSPWGLWLMRRRLPIDGEIRVYPNLLSERRQVAALFLPRGPAGMRPQRQLGQGREFEKLREYLSGDPWDEIHWKASAKRGRPVTKLFQVERTQEVYVVIDASRLSARAMGGSGPHAHAVLQIDRYIIAALLLGIAAQRQGDLFGLVVFSNQWRAFLRAAGGREHFLRCREALHALQAEDASPDFAELFAGLRTRLRRRALLLVLTALDDPLLAEDFERGVQLVARQHLVLVSQLSRGDSRSLWTGPPAQVPEDICHALASHTRWQTLRTLAGRLHRLGVTFSVLHEEQLAAALVSQYINVKRRQAL